MLQLKCGVSPLHNQRERWERFLLPFVQHTLDRSHSPSISERQLITALSLFLEFSLAFQQHNRSGFSLTKDSTLYCIGAFQAA